MPRSSPSSMSSVLDAEYTYDFPVASTSSILIPTPHRRRRSQSPTKLHLSKAASPSTRESDVARLLDPTYSSPKNASNAAYVDHHGDLHDPDYRHFPPVAHHHTKTLTRPRWELATGDAIDEEDDAVQVDAFSIIRPASPRRHRDSTSTYRGGAPSYVSSFPHSSFTAPTSFDSDETALEEEEVDDPFDDDEKVIAKCPITKKSKKQHVTRSRRSSQAPIEPEKEDESRPIIASSSNDQRDQEEEEAEEAGGYVPSKVAEEQQDWTPTCSQSIRRQWQSLTLSLRFTLFRAKRRVRRILQPH